MCTQRSRWHGPAVGSCTPPSGQTKGYVCNPQMIGAMTFLQDAWKDGVVNPNDESQRLDLGDRFRSWRARDHPRHSSLDTVAAKAGISAGVAPIPGQIGGYSTYVGGDDLGVITGCQSWLPTRSSCRTPLASRLEPTLRRRCSSVGARRHLDARF